MGEKAEGKGAYLNAHTDDAAMTRAHMLTTAMGAAEIGEGTITTTMIANAAITNAKIGAASIDAAKIQLGTITTALIADATITAAKIEDLTVTNAKIAEAAISAAKIADAAITRAKMADAAIGDAQIENMSVSTAKIADAAITRAKIADAAVGTAEIDNLSVTTAKIALGAITTALIEQGAIGTAQIADGSITDAKIVELTANKINAGTLSVERLIIVGSDQSIVYTINEANGTAQLSQTTIDGGSLTERSITADRIVAGAITADEIAAATILANNIASGAITADKIAAGAVDATKIKAGSVTTPLLATSTITDIGGMIKLQVDGVKNGGTNLILDSKEITLVGSGSGSTNKALYAGPWLSSTEYTLSIDAVAQTAGTLTPNWKALLYDGSAGVELEAKGMATVASRQSWTFTTPATIPADLRLLIYCGWPGATSGKTFVYSKVMLEQANKPSAWSPAPADPAGSVLSGSNIEIRENQIKLISPSTVIGVPVLDSQGNPTEQMQMQIDSDGVEAQVITSPSVPARYTGPSTITVNPNGGAHFRSLNDACDSLSNRMLDYDVIIQVASGVTLTMSSRAALRGIYGGGAVTIEGGGSTINGAFIVTRCSSPVTIRNMTINNTIFRDSTGYMISSALTFWLGIDNVKVNGNGTTVSSGVYVSDGTKAHISNLEVNDTRFIIQVQGSALATALDTRGTTNSGVFCRIINGGTLFLGGTRGAGSFSNSGGQVNDNSTSINAGAGGTPVPIPTTVTYNATNTGWYQTAWKSNETNMLQGYTASGEITGAMWFDNTALRTALNGKSILSATLRLHRRSGYGRSSGIAVKLCGITNATKSGSPSRAKSYGQIASLTPNQNLIITIPVEAISDLRGGIINALALYAADGKVISGKDYSTNYGSLTGSAGGSNAPQLVITYR